VVEERSPRIFGGAPKVPAEPGMKSGPLLKVSVATTLQAEEAVAELLGNLLGQAASTYHDIERGTVCVSVYLADARVWSNAKRHSLLEGLRQMEKADLHPGSKRISTRKIRSEDWAESWKRHFKPLDIGSALLVKPSWSKRRALARQATVVLDPGLSFGTGQHPTTSFCLQQLVACRSKADARSLLDIGTGSGILAIAAAKLGYQPIEAIDFDADAVRIARCNARLNGVVRQIQFAHRDLTRLPRDNKRPFDVICANLIADLLITEHRRILGRLKPGGVLVVAGILRSQFESVRKVYETAGLKLQRHRAEKEWESGRFVFA
jgi:ribosomal protein L11 methyltransferase